ncbi:MAG: hypothetical protein JXQ29_10385 [Planctomycetes bacterium]|nr:hypothetical protein [Planctomycetota bacterium]
MSASVHRRHALLAAAILLILGPGMSFAQPSGADLLSVDSGGCLWKTTPTGNATRLLALPAVAHGLCVHHDNTLLYITQSGSPGQIVQFDPVNRVVVTVFNSPTLTPYEVIQNADGDLVFTGAAPGPLFGLFKLSGGQVSTIITTVQLGVQTTSLSAGLGINVDTGNYLLVGGAYAPWAGQKVWDVSDIGVVVTLGSSGNSRYSHTQDPDTGDIYIGGYQEIFVLKRGMPDANTLLFGPADFYAITMERSSAPQSVIVSRSAAYIHRIDVGSLAITSVIVPNSGSTTYETVFEQHRTLATVKTGPRRWQIKLNFGPSEARYRYLLALSLHGVRPAAKLPDGRRIHLMPDDLTVLSLRDQLPAYFNPGLGILDPAGCATGWLDVSTLPAPPPLFRLPVYIAALTVGPNGVSQISKPVTLLLP